MIILPSGRMLIYKGNLSVKSNSYQSTFKERPSKDGRFKCAMVYIFYYDVFLAYNTLLDIQTLIRRYIFQYQRLHLIQGCQKG